jgi:hypothetical protein
VKRLNDEIARGREIPVEGMAQPLDRVLSQQREVADGRIEIALLEAPGGEICITADGE